ncbi:hypothetical protein ACFPIF_13680 [Brevundimonas faecalis]
MAGDVLLQIDNENIENREKIINLVESHNKSINLSKIKEVCGGSRA